MLLMSACTGPMSAVDNANPQPMRASVNDSLRNDPQSIDPNFPPGVVELSFKSKGDRLNGHIYLANGSGPHPTVVLLHGYPGNEKNLDLAQALRRDGFNVLFFHYRGAWGSAGRFSYPNVVDDVASATTMLREQKQELRVDPTRLIFIGHSMGGFAALQGAARDPAVRCVAGLAAADLGTRAALYAANPSNAKGFIRYGDNLQMLAGWSGQQAVDEIITYGEDFKLTNLGASLHGKSVLLIAADQDSAVPAESNHAPVVAAYSAIEAIDLTEKVITGDHSFSWSRILLIEEVLDWAQACK